MQNQFSEIDIIIMKIAFKKISDKNIKVINNEDIKKISRLVADRKIDINHLHEMNGDEYFDLLIGQERLFQ